MTKHELVQLVEERSRRNEVALSALTEPGGSAAQWRQDGNLCVVKQALQEAREVYCWLIEVWEALGESSALHDAAIAFLRFKVGKVIQGK